MTTMPSALATAPQQAGPLTELVTTAAALIEQGEKVQVIFDLDDTLFLVRPRKRVIFRELAEAHQHDEALHQALHTLAGAEIPYDVKEALGTVGITHPEKVNLLKDAFFARFFDGDYTRHDAPNEGALHYLLQLHGMGVRVVYLTGRPEEMEARTLTTLAAHGFPLDERTALVLKRTHESHLGDAEFKGIKGTEIAQWGRVLGVFDNEPANLNAMYPACPSAWYFLLDTDHSPNPPELAMAHHVMTDFSKAVKRLESSLAATPSFGGGHWTLNVQVGA